MVEVVAISASEQLICCQGKVVRIELLNHTLIEDPNVSRCV